MVSYLGSLVQFSPATGRAGAADRCRCVWGALAVFRPHWVCPVQGCLCVPVYTAQAPGCSIWSGPCAECGSIFRVLHKSADSIVPAFCVFPGLSGSGSQRLGALSTGAPRLFPLRPVRCLRFVFVLRSWPLAATLPAADVDHPESQEVFRQDPGPVCRVGGGGFSGAEFAPCPSPCLLPPVGMGRLFSGVSQSLCFANRRRCVPAG